MLSEPLNPVAKPDADATSPQPEGRFSRRTFLRTSAAAGGGLLLAVALPGPARFAAAAEMSTAENFAPNAFVRIGRDGRVVLIVCQVEMGQGTYTSMPMLIAEELEVDLNQVDVEAAPPDDKLYANPLVKFQVTGGSTSVRAFWKPLREAGAAARILLVEAAAQTWGVDPASCHAEKGEVIHEPTGRKVAYGKLVDKAATLPLSDATKIVLKDPKDFKIIGKSVKRIDTPAKVDGSAKYGIDVEFAGHEDRSPCDMSGVRRKAQKRRRGEGQIGERRPSSRATRGRRGGCRGSYGSREKRFGGAQHRMGRRTERQALDRRYRPRPRCSVAKTGRRGAKGRRRRQRPSKRQPEGSMPSTRCRSLPTPRWSR